MTGLLLGIFVCAILVIQARSLLTSILWLGGMSLLTALVLYQMGAHLAAVIELSVGAGLVLVLLMFALALTGEDVPNFAYLWRITPLIGGLIALLLFSLPSTLTTPTGENTADFATLFWQERWLDTALQLGLMLLGIFSVQHLLKSLLPAGQKVKS